MQKQLRNQERRAETQRGIWKDCTTHHLHWKGSRISRNGHRLLEERQSYLQPIRLHQRNIILRVEV